MQYSDCVLCALLAFGWMHFVHISHGKRIVSYSGIQFHFEWIMDFAFHRSTRLNADAHTFTPTQTRETHSSRFASIGGCSECISYHGICMRQIRIPTSDISSQLNDKKKIFLLEYSVHVQSDTALSQSRDQWSHDLARLLARAASKVAPFVSSCCCYVKLSLLRHRRLKKFVRALAICNVNSIKNAQTKEEINYFFFVWK